jgi:type IV pilus assembly protein PilY1
VGDYGGQLWTVRFWMPGEWDAGRQQVGNWVAARSFRVANLAGRTTDPEALRPPISSIATNVVQPDTGALRTFVGTGDRQNLYDAGTSCRLSNGRGCAEMGCQVETHVSFERAGLHFAKFQAAFSGYRYMAGHSESWPTGPSCGGARARLQWYVTGASGVCPSNASGEIDFQCTSEPGGGMNCREAVNTWMPFLSTQGPSSTPVHRFYGIWSYGGTPSRTFNTEAEAASFDAQHFTDSNLMNAAMSPPEPPALSPGWYFPYAPGAERTATAATVVNGCVLWGSFEPGSGKGLVCGAPATGLGRLYQAGSLNGRADCAAGFYSASTGTWARSLQFTTPTVPPEPTVRRVSAEGQSTTTSATLLTPGNLLSVPVSMGP